MATQNDWADTSYTLRPWAHCIDPWNNSIVRASMKNIVDASVTWGYETDTIASAHLTTVGDDGYVDGSRIRLYYVVPELNVRDLLFTGYVESCTPEYDNGVMKRSYNLKSILKVCQDHNLVYPYVMNSGETALAGMNHILTRAGYSLEIMPNALDYSYMEPTIWNVGNDSVYKVLEDLATVAGNRLMLDEQGGVRVERDVNPASLGVTWRFHDQSTRGLIIDGTVRPSENESSVPSRVIVVYGSGDNAAAGWAEVNPSSPSSAQRRGYQLDYVESSSDLPDVSVNAATQRANELLAQQVSSPRDWAMDTLFFPGRIGEAADLTLDGETYHTYIKNITYNLTDRKCNVTLKESA